jgi:nicotinate-nucleotide--dimethylbenzimidazole phosphoribosyltransferase
MLEQTLAAIAPIDESLGRETQKLLDQKTKPRGSLGKLERLAVKIAALRGVARPELPVKAIVVMGADHGVAAEGVSAYPQEVTRQMLLNFAGGGAAINVLSRQAGARLVVGDLGIVTPLEGVPAVRDLRIGPGTRNFAAGPAMTHAEARRALEAGIGVARELVADGVTLVALGEMGIGNTTSASALTAAFTGADVDAVTGRGTGVDDQGLARKRAVIRRALALHGPRPRVGAPGSSGATPTGFDDALGTLANLGGFEIAGLAGVALGCAAARVPVLLDGFISSVAGLAASRLAPRARGYLLASHRSVEGGHRYVLDALDLEPMFDLDLRLGEGTGAALAMHWVDAALRILHEMSTFEAAGVSDSGA